MATVYAKKNGNDADTDVWTLTRDGTDYKAALDPGDIRDLNGKAIVAVEESELSTGNALHIIEDNSVAGGGTLTMTDMYVYAELLLRGPVTFACGAGGRIYGPVIIESLAEMIVNSSSAMYGGLLIVKSGGTLTIKSGAASFLDSVICEPGGEIVAEGDIVPSVYVQTGGLLSMPVLNSMIQNSCVVDSGGVVNAPQGYVGDGFCAGYAGADITMAEASQQYVHALPGEHRTAPYTGDMATEITTLESTPQTLVNAGGLVDPAKVLEDEPLWTDSATLGTLPLAEVMQSAGGNLLVTDVRSDTVTGEAAGGTLDITADNVAVPAGIVQNLVL